jgi:hypothetical protein
MFILLVIEEKKINWGGRRVAVLRSKFPPLTFPSLVSFPNY